MRPSTYWVLASTNQPTCSTWLPVLWLCKWWIKMTIANSVSSDLSFHNSKVNRKLSIEDAYKIAFDDYAAVAICRRHLRPRDELDELVLLVVLLVNKHFIWSLDRIRRNQEDVHWLTISGSGAIKWTIRVSSYIYATKSLLCWKTNYFRWGATLDKAFSTNQTLTTDLGKLRMIQFSWIQNQFEKIK